MTDPRIAAAESGSDAVLFANADWRVLPDGLEHRATGYFVAREGLDARHGDGLWAWPLRLSEKAWCAPRAFREAFLAALAEFGLARDAALTRSFAAAFGLRPAGEACDGFVPLGDLVRPKGSARKPARPAAMWAVHRRDGRRLPAGAHA